MLILHNLFWYLTEYFVVLSVALNAGQGLSSPDFVEFFVGKQANDKDGTRNGCK